MARTLLTCDGGQAFKELVQLVAKSKKKTMAKLVREALDAVYGDEFKRAASFFASSDTSSTRTMTDSCNPENA